MKRKHNIELAGTLTENKIVIYGNKLSLEWISPTQILVFTRAKIKEAGKMKKEVTDYLIKEADMKTKEIDDCLTGERLKQFDIFVRGLSVKHLGLMTDWCHDIKNHYAQETKLATLKEVLKQWRIDQSANAYEDFSKWLEAEIKEVGKNAF